MYYYLRLIFCFVIFLSVLSCEKDETTSTDEELYYMAIDEEQSFTWYKNSNILLNNSGESGHSQPYFRTRYNSIAAEMLDENGKVLEGADFPEGSLIVKELIGEDEDIEFYAILYKKSDHKYADVDGWVWGYVEADGAVRQSASNKGSGCIVCHSQTGNIDHTLMNKYFP
jgi:hypothetical protein